MIAKRTDFPWTGVGTTVEESMTTRQMLQAAKLDWAISKEPLYVLDDRGDRHVFKDNFGLVREDTQEQIGICGKGYQPIQNKKALEFFEKFIECGDMRMEAIGSFHVTKGLHIWALASMKHEFELPGQDVVQSYVLLSHPHIWGQTLQIKPTAMRIYCYNSLMAALRGSPSFKHRHMTEFGDAALSDARDVVRATIAYVDSVKEKAQFLASRPATIDAIARYVAELFNPALLNSEAIFGREAGHVDPINFGRNASKVWQSVFKSPGAHVKSAEGTWWGAFNGVTYAVDHMLGTRREFALCDAWLGERSSKKARALELAVEYAT